MQAMAVFPEKREVGVIDDFLEPHISGPTEVKLRMLEVGICGTDKEIVAFDYGTPPAGSEYLVLGHECLAEVVEVGPNVTRVKPGDLAVVMVRRPCPHEHCLPCRAGRQDFCATGDYTERGIQGQHGFLTNYIVDEEQYLAVAPHDLRDVAVLVEPLTIAEKAFTQVWQIQQRLPWGETGGAADRPLHRAVVIGAGPVSLLGAMGLIHAGFETYIYSRTNTPKAVIAESFGAKFIASDKVPVEELARQVGNIDLVYEGVGVSALAFDVLRVLGTNGVFIFTGVPGLKEPIAIDTDRIMREVVLKNQILLGTVNAGRDAHDAAIRDLGLFKARWPEALSSLISGRYPLSATPDILQGKIPAGSIKNVIALHE